MLNIDAKFAARVRLRRLVLEALVVAFALLALSGCNEEKTVLVGVAPTGMQIKEFESGAKCEEAAAFANLSLGSSGVRAACFRK